MKKGKIEETGKLREGELDLINKHTRREHAEDEIYAFSVCLCDNDIDRDNERFSDEALDTLSKLFDGRTGICDHSAKSENQKARIFSTYTEMPQGEYTRDGRAYKRLCARAYMLKTKQNENLIAEIEAGIKKEVSIGCSVKSRTCSVCGKERTEGCLHKSGRTYKTASGEMLCHTVLSDPADAYEWSFVAVPAQKRAGITKSFEKKEIKDLKSTDIVKQLASGTEVTLSASEAEKLSCYIGELKNLGELGKSFIAEKRAAVIKGCEKVLCGINAETLNSVTEKMSVSELDEFYRALKAQEKPQVQLSPAANNDKSVNNGFMI